MATYKSAMGWTLSVKDVGAGPSGKYRWEVKKGMMILTGYANTKKKALKDSEQMVKSLVRQLEETA